MRAEGQYYIGRDARWTTRYATGNAASQVEWRRGSREGGARFWYPDGRPWWRGQYRDNAPSGTWVHWDRAGRRRDVDPRREAVGPLAEPHDYGPADDAECAYHSIVNLMWALEKRRGVVVTRDDAVLTYTRADGLVLGSIGADGREGEIIDESGELVARAVEGEQYDCRDAGGRRVGTSSWFDTTRYREIE